MDYSKVIKTGKRIVQPKGNSLWIDKFTMPITVVGITVECSEMEDNDPSILIWVRHNGPWEIYTDTGFEKGISEIMSTKLGFDVKISFTEQGMQRRGIASMESGNKKTDKLLYDWLIGLK